jgi:hypothetical protein
LTQPRATISMSRTTGPLRRPTAESPAERRLVPSLWRSNMPGFFRAHREERATWTHAAMFSIASIFANPVVAFFVDYIAINHRPLAVIFVVLPLSFALRCVFAVFEWQQVLPSVVSCCRRFVAASVTAAEGTLADDQGQPVRQARG